MSCTHVPDCPLFPKLNASLRGWRDAYCDSESAWRGCARFEQSQSGRAVPLALLPNGRLVHTIASSRATAAAPSRFRTAPLPAVADGGSPFEREHLEPAPEPPADPAPARAQVAVRVRPAVPRPGRWARIVAWMRGAA